MGGYHITGIEKFANGDLKHLGKPKVQLTFYLDHNGILQLVKQATLEEMIVPKRKMKLQLQMKLMVQMPR